ncbi:Ig-like domain-containing protein, partial [Sulfitobacter noctilucicola]
ANDTDPNGDPLTITEASVPEEQGTVDIVDNQLVFTPAEDFTGEAEISYTVEDPDGNADEGTVTVTVNPVNDAPDAVDDVATTEEDTPVVLDLIDNDSDPEDDLLTVTEVSVPEEQGTVVNNGDGTATFTPAPDFVGEATVTYTIADPDGEEDTAVHVVDVTPINDAPDAVDDADVTDEDTPVTVDLLANDTDVDGDDLRVVEATVPEEEGTLVDNGDGTVTFTPAPDFNGDATITYTISDGNGGEDTAEHVITVGEENDAPVTEPDTLETDEDTPSEPLNVLANDTDPDGDPLELIEATSPDGTVAFTPEGEVIFTPDPDFNGETTITYTVTDPSGEETEGTVT